MKKQRKIKVLTRKEEIGITAEKEFPGTAENAQISERLGFILGAHWADIHPKSPWISVEDDLPCNYEELVHSNYTDRVLVLSRNGYSEVAFMCIIEDVWEWNTLITVLYWMPIPKLPKE